MRGTRWGAIAIGGVLVLAGCGGGGSGTSSDGAGASAGTPAQGGPSGTLTFGYAGNGLTSLDPNAITSGTEKPLATLLYDGLTQRAPDGSTKPALATSWSTSSDGRTWTFKLRSGVKYHDGRAFTAKDAVANIERVLDPDVASQVRKRVVDVKQAVAKGPHTLVIKLSQPNALLPTALVDLKMTDVGTIKKVNDNGNGTGPYELQDFVPDDHVTLKANPDYWGPKPKLQTIRIVRAADTTSAVTSLRTGELTMLWGVPPTDAKTLQSADSVSFLKPAQNSGTVAWELDMTSPPFDKLAARQALAYAVNRNAYLSAAFQGFGQASPSNVPVAPGNPAYAGDLPSYPFDLDKAKQLFQQAGVGPGSTLTFWTTAGRNPQWLAMAQILQQDLKKIGINLKIQQKEASTWLQKFFPAGKKYPGTIVANYLSLPSTAPYALQFFVSGGCECNWNDKAYDSLLGKALETSDEGQRTAMLKQLEDMVSKTVPAVIPLQSATIVAAQKNVHGAWAESDGTVHLEQASVGA
jgi:peptide/nickel transport system substrate-binding protein